MIHVYMLFIWLLTIIPQSFGLNALFLTIGAAGHSIPMFELAKSMKNHNVTFITESFAQSYINVEMYSNRSSFRLIFTNDSTYAIIDENKIEKDIIEYFMDHSLFDSIFYIIPATARITNALMNKAIHLLMSEQFDVIIGSSLVFGLDTLCQKANTSCVVQRAEVKMNIFDMNLPNSYSLLSSKEITEFKYRIYNVVFSLRLIMMIFKKLIESFYIVLQSFPQIPGSFYDTFTLRNILLTESKCLNLIGLPPTLYPSSYSHHLTKYLGGFIDESSIDYVDNDLTTWVKLKPINSIIYAAFGSTGVIRLDRMKNLIYGLAEFLLQTDSASVILAFRNRNYNNYQIVLNELQNVEYRRVLMDNERVKVEHEFVQQKWILQQNSINLFLSHCGTGSSVEGLYFEKPILCLPIHTDQFLNSIAIENSGVGQSLFQPPSLLDSFLNPHDYHDYKFLASSVTKQLSTMWRNNTYEKAARLMSLQMKHAGGVKRAVQEIELLVSLNGDLNRYAPFHSTLPFYQRYMLDLIFVYIVLPVTITFYLFVRCYKRRRKEKND